MVKAVAVLNIAVQFARQALNIVWIYFFIICLHRMIMRFYMEQKSKVKNKYE